jgi:hypothetical protein
MRFGGLSGRFFGDGLFGADWVGFGSRFATRRHRTGWRGGGNRGGRQRDGGGLADSGITVGITVGTPGGFSGGYSGRYSNCYSDCYSGRYSGGYSGLFSGRGAVDHPGAKSAACNACALAVP